MNTMENTNNNQNTGMGGNTSNTTPNFQGMPSQSSSQSQQSFVPKPQMPVQPSFTPVHTQPVPSASPQQAPVQPTQLQTPKFSPFTPASSMTAQTAPAAPKPQSSSAPAASVSNMMNSNTTPNQAPRPAFNQSSDFAPKPTSSPLSNEVNKILNSSGTNGVPPHEGKKTMFFAIIGLMVLLALGGGAYYWYTNMPTSTDGTEMTDDTETKNPATSASSFPATVRPGAAAPVTTAPTTRPSTTVTSQADRAKVNSFIAANINNLAPVRSRTSYEVTDVTFDGPNRALVSYQDADGYYTAVATVGIDTSGNVRVTSFNPLDK